MECVFATIVLVAILVAFATQKHSTTSGTNDAYMRLAGRFGGKVTRGGWWRKPVVRFNWHGAPVLVDVQKATRTSAPAFTRVSIGWPDSQLGLEVYPAGVWSKVSRFLGLNNMRIGSVAFDEQYVINTSSPDEARQFLSTGVQWHIDRLCRLLGNGDIYVRVDRGTLLVRKKSFIRTYAELDQFVRLSLELYEQGILTQTAGIEFVSGPAPESPPICQVCGDGVYGDMVVCRRCQTPHHRECWHYYGACTTYGCGETRYDQPRVPGVVPGPHNGHPSGKIVHRN